MRICILAKDEDVKEVRERAQIIPELAGHPLMLTPVSKTGELPATHWFCAFNASEELFEKIKSIQLLSEVKHQASRKFLEERELKVIK